MQIEKMSYDQLAQLQAKVAAQMALKFGSITSDTEAKLRSEFAAKAKTLAESFVGERKVEAKAIEVKPSNGSTKAPVKQGVKRAKRHFKVKYRSGQNTWTGLGKPPKWLSALEAQGQKRDQFLVR